MKKIILPCLLLSGCVHGQYRVNVPGSGQLAAFVAENSAHGANASCFSTYTWNGTAMATAAQACGFYDASGNKQLSLTGGGATNLAVTIGATNVSSWYGTASNAMLDIANQSGSPGVLIIEGLTGAGEVIFRNGGAGTNNKIWDIINSSTDLHFRVFDDGFSTASDWLDVSRTGTTINSATFNETILFGSDNTYNVGSGSVAAKNVYSIGLSVGRAAALQGIIAVNNSANSNVFEFAGSNVVTGNDVGIGTVFGAASLYPLSSSIDLGGSSNRYRKIWVNDIDIGGTCTGCTAGANTALSNLTNPTSINQSLLFSSDGVDNIGSLTTEADNIFARSISLGNTSNSGAASFYNGSNSNPQSLTGTSVSGTSVDIKVGNAFFAGSFYGISNVTLGNSTNLWSTIYGNNYNFGGNSGNSASIVIGGCTLTFTSGGLTGHSGC